MASTQDFLSGIFDKLFQNLNGAISISSEKYIPYGRGKRWGEYYNIAQTNPIVRKAIKLRQANVGANGWDIVCNMYGSERRNRKVEEEVYNILERLGFEQMVRDISGYLATTGNCYLTFNDRGELILQGPELYHLYYDTTNQRPYRYAMVIDGVEQQGKLGNLQHGQDLYHFKAVDSMYKPLGDSPIDACHDWILLHLHFVQATNELASRGFVNTLFGLPHKELMDKFQEIVTEDKKTFAQTLGERIQNLFGGSRKSGRLAIATGLASIVEAGLSPDKMQFAEAQEIITEQIAKAWGFSLSDMGKDVTYNNAATFSYAQYDMNGRAEERQIEHATNTFSLIALLKIAGAINLLDAVNDGDLYVKFNEPKDPDENKNIELHLNILEKTVGLSDNIEYKEKVINEFRDKLGLDPIDQKLLELDKPEPQPNQLTGQPDVIDVETVTPEANQEEKFAKKTPIQKALESREFERGGSSKKKGFLPHWEGKLTEQLEEYISTLKGKDSIEEAISDLNADLKPITHYYKKKDLRRDLKAFAEFGVKEFFETTKESSENFAEEYQVPSFILELIKERTEWLLNGDKEYAGIDAETASQINTILEDNLEKGVEEVVAIMTSRIKEIATNRARLIATTEVANIVEESRYKMYEEAEYDEKKWFDVNDENVRSSHAANERQGWIPINEPFQNGNMKAGEEPNCRCTVTYRRSK